MLDDQVNSSCGKIVLEKSSNNYSKNIKTMYVSYGGKFVKNSFIVQTYII